MTVVWLALAGVQMKIMARTRKTKEPPGTIDYTCLRCKQPFRGVVRQGLYKITECCSHCRQEFIDSYGGGRQYDNHLVDTWLDDGAFHDERVAMGEINYGTKD